MTLQSITKLASGSWILEKIFPYKRKSNTSILKKKTHMLPPSLEPRVIAIPKQPLHQMQRFQLTLIGVESFVYQLSRIKNDIILNIATINICGFLFTYYN